MAGESVVNEVFRSITEICTCVYVYVYVCVYMCMFMHEPQKFPHAVIPLNNT